MAGVAPPPRLSTGSHHGERCADNVLAASGARPSSTTHYSPGVISSSRAGRQLEGRYAHGVQVCGLRERGEREREREEGQRDRESEEKTCHTVLASPLTISVPFPFHSDCIRNYLYCAHRHLPVPRVPTARVLHVSVVLAACVLVPRVSEREREVAAEGSNYPCCCDARPFDSRNVRLPGSGCD